MSKRCGGWTALGPGAVAIFVHLILFTDLAAQSEIEVLASESYVLAPGIGLMSEFGSEIKAGRAESEGSYTFTVTEKSAWGSPIHVHRTRDVLLLVLEGTLSLHLDGQTHEMPAGSFARVAKGSEHALGYYSEDRTQVVHVFLPGGWEDFWLETRELGERAERGLVDPDDYRALLIEIAERYDTEYIAPNPFARLEGGAPN